MQFTVNGFTIPEQNGAGATFGARLIDYPKMEDIPEEYLRGTPNGCKVAAALFYQGGSLKDHGLRIKDGVDRSDFITTLKSILVSYAPKHEVKMATAGMLIDEYTETLKTKV